MTFLIRADRGKLSEASKRSWWESNTRRSHYLIALAMRICVHFLALSVLLAGSVSPVLSDSMTVQSFEIKTAPYQSVLDILPEDPAWRGGISVGSFENVITRRPAEHKTRVYMSFDGISLRILFICDQSGTKLDYSQAVDDVGYGLDDTVTFAIDTSGSNSRTYAFSSTPKGTKYEYSSESNLYRPKWTAVARHDSRGYRVLMTIPVSTLRKGAGGRKSWRFNLTRRLANSGDLYSAAYSASDVAYCNGASAQATMYCDSTRWLTLIVHLAQSHQVQAPYADLYGLGTGGTKRSQFETIPGIFSSERTRSYGLDLTIPISATIAFVGALQPDFSNVEADQTIIAPQEFPQKYQEYRPFFSQGAAFVTPLPQLQLGTPTEQMFYSPALGIIDSGFKIEGTTGQTAIGALHVNGSSFDDEAFGISETAPDKSLVLAAQGITARNDGIIDNTFGLGVLASNPHSGFGPIASVEQESGTLVRNDAKGRSALVGLVSQHNGLAVAFALKDTGPLFAPINGYTAANDNRGPEGAIIYNGFGSPSSLLKSYTFGLTGDRFVDGSGAAHQSDAVVQAIGTLTNQVSVGLSLTDSELRTYVEPFPAYSSPENNKFDQGEFNVGYRDGTSTPIDASYSFGPYGVSCFSASAPTSCASGSAFASAFVQQLDVSGTRAFSGNVSATIEYGGTLEKLRAGASDSQWLRRLSVTKGLGSFSQIAFYLRLINGNGGYASPGMNLAASFVEHFANRNQLFVQYGSPAASTTLQRFIIKYVFRIGDRAAN